MKLTEIRLASTDHDKVIADVKNLFSDWNEGRQTLRLDSDKNIIPFTEVDAEMVQVGESPSGYRIDIFPIRDRVTKEAEYDEEGELISEAEYAGEKRVDIIAPDFYDMPDFETEVHPRNPDSTYST